MGCVAGCRQPGGGSLPGCGPRGVPNAAHRRGQHATGGGGSGLPGSGRDRVLPAGTDGSHDLAGVQGRNRVPGLGVRGTAGRRSPSGHAGGFRGSPGLRRMRRAPRDRTHSSSVPSTCHWRESQPHWPENRIRKATPPGRCDTVYRISPSVLTSTQTTCGHTGYASCGATDSRWAPP